jgi:hypothetical protein
MELLQIRLVPRGMRAIGQKTDAPAHAAQNRSQRKDKQANPELRNHGINID